MSGFQLNAQYIISIKLITITYFIVKYFYWLFEILLVWKCAHLFMALFNMLPCIERIVNDNTYAFSFPQLYI